MAKVSIIIPAYNVENYIAHGIKSCIEQTEKDIEIIIVDDGSTDSTLEIIQQYASEDSRIKYFHQINKGVSTARNLGLDNAKGNYVIFLDSDDWLEKDCIEVLLQNIKTKDGFIFDLICSECFYVTKDVNNIIIRDRQGKNENSCVIKSDELLKKIGIRSKFKLNSSCYKLYKRDIIETSHIRFNTEIHQGEDGLFVFNYLLQINNIKYINRPLWDILERPGSACTGGYTPKWKSAIKSIDIMLSHSELDKEIVNQLITYRIERASWIILECLRSKYSNKQDVCWGQNLIKDSLKKYKSFNIRNTVGIKYLIIKTFPYFLLKFLIKLKR